jgi:hypothetical protein
MLRQWQFTNSHISITQKKQGISTPLVDAYNTRKCEKTFQHHSKQNKTMMLKDAKYWVEKVKELF